MNELKNFLKMTILGGFFIILPLILLFYLFHWFIMFLIDLFEPLNLLYQHSLHLNIYFSQILSISTFLMLCFIIGVLVKTQLGIYIHFYFDYLLKKIPGYSILSDILNQFFGKEKKTFRKVVLIDRYSNGIYETGFITDEYLMNNEKYYSVFLPTGPNPTSGFIIQLRKEQVVQENIKVDKAMKSIIACGAGSSNIWGDKDV